MKTKKDYEEAISKLKHESEQVKAILKKHKEANKTTKLIEEEKLALISKLPGQAT